MEFVLIFSCLSVVAFGIFCLVFLQRSQIQSHELFLKGLMSLEEARATSMKQILDKLIPEPEQEKKTRNVKNEIEEMPDPAVVDIPLDGSMKVPINSETKIQFEDEGEAMM